MNVFGRKGEAQLGRLSEASRCTKCHTRWRQSKLGLCRRCERELGIEAEGTAAREKERVEKTAAKLALTQREFRNPIERKLHAALMRRPRRLELTPDGGHKDRDYIVVWAGDMDGAEAMGLPMAEKKRSSYRATEHWTEKGS